MKKWAYYNDVDPAACVITRELIKRGVICDGEVDQRSIKEVQPEDVAPFIQAHFFCGGSLWSVAARLAGWPDDRPLWTGSCPCFPAGTLVFTARGYLPIEVVEAGDLVLTHQGRWRSVTHTGSEEADCVTLKGQGHFGLTCTPGHPFLSADNEWTAAHEMKGRRWASIASVPTSTVPELAPSHRGYFFDASVQGFRVKGSKDGLPVHVGLYKTAREAGEARQSAIEQGRIDVRGAEAADPCSLGFARFLGYWLGDGWVSGDNVIICGALEHGDLLSEILTGARLPCSRSLERTSSRARCGSKALARWMTEQFGAGAAGKKIPAWLHGMPSDYRSEFLAGYAEADGHKEDMPRGGSVQRFTTVSRAVAIGIRVLLNQSGISASITRHHSGRETIIEGRRVSERPFFRITAYEASRSFRFTDLHGWGLVRSVEAAGRARVYNLAVEEDESYTADGIVVHNCQPFSAAGKGLGTDDPRHLWPDFHRLIRARRPVAVVGEQVAGKAGRNWFHGVRTDLAGSGYAGRAVDIPACAVDSPQQRQRLYWLALADTAGAGSHASAHPGVHRREEGAGARHGELERLHGADCQVADRARGEWRNRKPEADAEREGAAGGHHLPGSADGAVEGSHSWREPRRSIFGPVQGVGEDIQRAHGQSRRPNGSWWADAEWLACHDGKLRRTKPGLPLLVDGLPGRVGLWRIAGNAISPILAAEVIGALMDIMEERA